MTARIRVEFGGRVAPDAEASGELDARHGSFVLLPTAPDLLAALRQPPEGGRARGPRVVLIVDASGFPVSDLIAFLGQSRWSGTMRLHAPGGDRTVVLKDGEIHGASSEDPADRLSEVLVRLGHAPRQEVEEALRDNPPSRVGRALVDRGLLQPHDLWACVTQQVSDIFHAIVLAREGTFTLVDQEPDEKTGPTVQLSTQSLLMDAIRKVDELQHFRQRIPHGRVYMNKKRPSDGKLQPDEDRLLGLANGQRTVLELAQAAKLSEFDATKILFRLLEGGYASVSELKHGEVAVPARVRAGGRGAESEPALRVIATFEEIFAEIAREVVSKGMAREFLGAANAALASRTLSESPVLVGLKLGHDGRFDARKVLDAYTRARPTLGSEPVASLRQALSDVMFFLLFQAGELLESRADEDLARRVKDLLATLD
ncbi:MAG TPA: DUF4388 domain-containing protein [Myxococcaceae bacterium]|jgi:hypothetical protein|nr:DUF4388 domain-containing protein [Myxococcaceae bacterium]